MKAKKRFLSLLLCSAMLFSFCPQTAFAEGAEAGSLCEHHPQHTAECGYTEGGEGTLCTYVCEMATYRKAEAVVEQYNRDLAAWERQVREKQKPAQKEQAKPPERESVLKRLRQLQAEGKQRNQPRQRKKSFDRDSR